MNTTTTQSSNVPELTLEKLKEAMSLIEDIQKSRELLLEYMRSKGFDPEKGDKIIWPESMVDVFGGFLPPYVQISKHVNEPIFIKRFYIGQFNPLL